MKTSAILVNVTRGEVMVEADLVDALASGSIRVCGPGRRPHRAATAREPPLGSAPGGHDPPITAGASQFRKQRNLDRFVRNLERFRRGEALEGEIDKGLGY